MIDNGFGIIDVSVHKGLFKEALISVLHVNMPKVNMAPITKAAREFWTDLPSKIG